MTAPVPGVAPQSGLGETIVLVDDFGRPVGYDTSAHAHSDQTPLHLGFMCYLADDRGRVLVTRRSAAALLFPGVHTCSVRGHLGAAEPATGAIARRVAVELGMLLVGLRLVLPAFRYRAELGGIIEHELCPVFVGRARGDLVLDPAYTASADWVPWSSYREDLLHARRPAAPWATLAVAALYRLGDDPLDWPSADLGDLPQTMAYAAELDTARLEGALGRHQARGARSAVERIVRP